MRELPTGTVTLLFTDIEGSTRLLQQVGERYAGVLAECRQLLRTVFQQWHGHEVDTQGDSFFVAFARATDAIAAAVAMQRALAARAWPNGVTIPVRMGLHTGEPLRTAEGYVGLDVHHAARIMSAGHGGQVVLSHTTRDLVEQTLPDGVSLRDLGAHRLKDLHLPSQLFQLVIEGLPTDFPPLKTLDKSPNNLPLQPTPFLGREKEVDAAGHLLLRDSTRLVTLTGPGGVGKTRLALQVAADLAEHFPDGTWFVSLAPIHDPDLVLPTISQVLGLREARDQSPLEHVKSALQAKKVLLLLDNFEQVVSAALAVADLLAGCPRLTVLVTSREGLHVRAEREFPVPALALPDPRRLPDPVALSQYEAVALFIERAQTVTPQFEVTNTNAPAVAEICTRLDGLPLAIELAAARIRLFPPQALLTRLGQRLPLLTSSARDVPARQQTLRSTIKWSYDLLTSDEQRLFRRLSVFAGGCTLEAAESVSATLGDALPPVLDRVASLLDKSLLLQTAQQEEEPRLTMLETIREYGLECLAVSGEMVATQQAHTAYYLRLAEEAELGIDSPLQTAWLDHLELEHDNLRAALQRLLKQEQDRESIEMALRFAGALSEFWRIHGHGSEGQTFLNSALAASGGVATSVRVKVLASAGIIALDRDDFERAEVLCEERLALCRQLGDTQGIAYSLHLLAWAARERGDLTRAGSLFEEALAIRRKLGNKYDIGASLLQWGILMCWQGEYARAGALIEESLTLFREMGQPRLIGWSLYKLAEVLFLSQGDLATVRSLLVESLPLFRAAGEPNGITSYFYLSGRVALSQEDVALARSLAEQGLAIAREGGARLNMVVLLSLLGAVEARQGEHATARTLYEESLAIAMGVGAKQLVAACLEGLASVIAGQGEPAWAARLWGAAEALRETIGKPLPPIEQDTFEHSIAAARAHLGEKPFTFAWSEGRAMTPEQALAAKGHTTIFSPPPSKPSPTYPDGLTAREVEVLRLVAQGRTDAQIAEQLIISPRTVNNHLTSIYGKLQITSRAAATRYAMEHHLV